jgi:hypothetical protein
MRRALHLTFAAAFAAWLPFGSADLVSAVPVACTTLPTLADLQAATDGCFIQDKLYSFGAGSYTGGGSIGAAQVNASVTFDPTDSGQIHGWSFKPVGLWSSDFSISYTISVSPDSPLAAIDASQLQALFGFSGSPQVVMTENAGALPTLTATPGDETRLAIFNPVTSISVVNTATVNDGRIVSVENLFRQTVIPEPGTLLLVGMGAVALAALRARRR